MKTKDLENGFKRAAEQLQWFDTLMHVRLYTWLRLWHMDDGAAVRALASDRDNTHSLTGHGDVSQRTPDNCCSCRAHWHLTVQQNHWKVRWNKVKKRLELFWITKKYALCVCACTLWSGLTIVSGTSRLVVFWGRGWGRGSGQGTRFTLPLQYWTCAVLQVSGARSDDKYSQSLWWIFLSTGWRKKKV